MFLSSLPILSHEFSLVKHFAQVSSRGTALGHCADIAAIMHAVYTHNEHVSKYSKLISKFCHAPLITVLAHHIVCVPEILT